MGGPGAAPVGLWVLGIGSGVLVAVITVAAIRVGVAALGTPADRAAANRTLQQAAGLLGGRYRDRREHPWYRRPAQYGTVEGTLGGIRYELSILPHNTADHGGSALLRTAPHHGHPAPPSSATAVTVSPHDVWHWPDLADPRTLAEFVRHATTAADPPQPPPEP